MIQYTDRLDKALRKAAWCHAKQKQVRKGSDTPYIAHPYAVMFIVSNETDDEDVLIACLLHDVLEDVNSKIYDESSMRKDFGDRVVSIVKDLTKDKSLSSWRKRGEAYLHHLEFDAGDEAMLISSADKLHNLQTILIDYADQGDTLWERFTTKSAPDQLWWYESVLDIYKKRGVPSQISDQLDEKVQKLRSVVKSPKINKRK